MQSIVMRPFCHDQLTKSGGWTFSIVMAIGVGRRGKMGNFPTGNWDTNEISLVSLKLIELILAMTVYFSVWHSHCARAKLTVLVSCRDALLVVQSCPLMSFACRGRLRNLWTDCSTIGLYCVTMTWQQIFKGSLRVAAIGILPPVTVERRCLGR